ncbi:MAG: hypothetical protein A3J37_05590 [Alphaproteobacteria bacterium RIFCSPHIGHO2_12_FULL_45_9]|nr:MAG: hypothetical protein A3B66_05630 [Alphaproteobacteria bacterium RIFCSPHIGHO2_02_FULL_46_13]OFW97373.1 MAG: hypothetical protein A3J37_05590 [Alphaproteobacteria bacterium RIFCSPHIGHO2_12_FULL_45_9]
MNLHIVDRRLAGKGKNIGNVERFKRRYKGYIRDAVERALGNEKIGGINDVDITIPKKDLSQPTFNHAASGGIRETVHPGNREYVKGDRIAKPQGGQQQGGGSGDGDGMDDYTFQISRKEAYEILLEGCGLPNMIKEYLLGDSKFKLQRSGIVKSGTPNNLDIVRSMRGALARRIALDAPTKREIALLKEKIETTEDAAIRQSIQDQIDTLMKRPKAPFLDPIDLRYRSRERVPKPQTKAVFFRMMDVSGSMGEQQKNDAKLFYTLVGLMLDREYEHIEIVNIRYHSKASECDEENFFYNPETGGTAVAPALNLMEEIIKDRYSPDEWNIYGGLVSDGDTGTTNDERSTAEIIPRLVALCQHFFYIELRDEEKDLGNILKNSLSGAKNFSMKTKVNRSNLGEVFRGFFKKRGLHEESRPHLHYASHDI